MVSRYIWWDVMTFSTVSYLTYYFNACWFYDQFPNPNTHTNTIPSLTNNVYTINTFPPLLHVSLNNHFVLYLLQLYFSIYCALCVLTCYIHLVNVHYALGVHVTWVPVMVNWTNYCLSPNLRVLPLLSWLLYGVRFML